MHVLILGSGAREHMLARKVAASKLVKKVFCAPGNGGTALCAENLPLGLEDVVPLLQTVKERKIDLVVVGPEEPLAAGLVDRLEEKGVRVFGPGRRAARLEASKVYAKTLMRKAGIPTAEGKVFSRAEDALAWAKEAVYPLVVKADGLAAGKGSFVCRAEVDAIEAIETLLVKRKLGAAGDRVLIEEAYTGKELTVQAICGATQLVVLEEARDYKRLRDGDEGPMTGGMGAISASTLLDARHRALIEEKVLVGALHALRRDDAPFRGLLYAGIMLSPTGPKVLEYNVRFGDPEAQAVLARLRSDVVPLLTGAVDDTLDGVEVEWDPRPSVTVVMAAAGYPEKPRIGMPIEGLARADLMPDVYVTHGATTRELDGRCTVKGGRVVSVTALGDTLAAARTRAYEAVKAIRFDGAVYRTDIGS